MCPALKPPVCMACQVKGPREPGAERGRRGPEAPIDPLPQSACVVAGWLRRGKPTPHGLQALLWARAHDGRQGPHGHAQPHHAPQCAYIERGGSVVWQGGEQGVPGRASRAWSVAVFPGFHCCSSRSDLVSPLTLAPLHTSDILIQEA